MARLVKEIMNRELFSARPQDRADKLIGYFSALGIGASPVLDPDGRLMGMISLRDLVQTQPDAQVQSLMNKTVMTVEAEAAIEQAARLIAETGYHRLPVVNHHQQVVGIVSSLDIIRGLLGMPARHPETFSHYDEDTGLNWTDDTPLEIDRIEAAPDAPGVVAIVSGGAGVRERVVWAETTNNMRTRLIDMLSLPQNQYPALKYWLDQHPLRFRAAAADREAGSKVVDKLQRRAGHARI